MQRCGKRPAVRACWSAGPTWPVPREVAPDVLRAVLEALQAMQRPSTVACARLAVDSCWRCPRRQAQRAGWMSRGAVLPAHPDAQGRWRVPDQPGYWQWRQGGRQQAIAVAPQRAWWPLGLLRGWGLSAQVYSLRARDDAGIGDSAGCARWSELLHRHGGDAVALSPLHAGLPPGPGYSPIRPATGAGSIRCRPPCRRYCRKQPTPCWLKTKHWRRPLQQPLPRAASTGRTRRR